MTPPRDKYDTRNDDAAAKAAAILRENDPLNSREQAAMDTITERAWVLWHTSTIMSYAHGVIRLLSSAQLLRDKAHEDEQEQALAVEAGLREERRARDVRAISQLDAVLAQAVTALRNGEPPADVADRLESQRDRVFAARDRAPAAEGGERP